MRRGLPGNSARPVAYSRVGQGAAPPGAPFNSLAGFDSEELMTEGQIAVVPAGHPLAARKTLSLTDVSDVPDLPLVRRFRHGTYPPGPGPEIHRATSAGRRIPRRLLGTDLEACAPSGTGDEAPACRASMTLALHGRRHEHLVPLRSRSQAKSRARRVDSPLGHATAVDVSPGRCVASA